MFYARQMLNRPGVSFGSHHHREADRRPPSSSSRDGGIDNDGGGGGISRFAQQRDRRQHRPSQRPRQHRQAAFARHHREEVIFQEEDPPGDDYHVDDDDDAPIEGSIHAHEMRNFSQVTLSQLSDGPSVRSFRSHRTASSQRSAGAAAALGGRGGGGGGFGIAGRNGGRMAGTREGSHGLGDNDGSSLHRGNRESDRGGGLNLHERRRVYNANASGSQPRRDAVRDQDDDDADSLRSSQPLLSQANRPPSNGGATAMTTSSDGTRRPPSSDADGSCRPLSGGRSEQRTRQTPSFSRSSRTTTTSRATGSRGRDGNDDNATLQSQSLLSPMPTSTVPSIAPRCLDSSLKRQNAGGTVTMTSHSQQQPSSQRGRSGTLDRTPGLMSGLSSLRDYNRRATTATATKTSRYHHPPFGGAATLTTGAVSGTIASLSTPSRAFGGIVGLAARTSAGLAALSPFRVNGRIRSTIGSTLGSAFASSAQRSSAPLSRPGAGSSVLASSLSNRSRGVLTAGNVDCYFSGPGARQETTYANRIGELRTALPTEQRIDEQNVNSSSMCDEESDGAQKIPQAEKSKSLRTRMCDDAASMSVDDRTRNFALDVAETRFTKNVTRDQDPPNICVAGGLLNEVMVSKQPHHQGAPENKGLKSFPPNNSSQTAPQKQEVDLNTTKPLDALPQSEQTTLFKTIDAKAKYSTRDNQDYDDDISKGSGSTLDIHGKTEEIIAATRALNHQYEQLEKSKQEYIEMNERARQELKEEYGKLEVLQKSMHDKYGMVQSSMDDFSTKIAHVAHDHELTIRNLVNMSMNELRQESIRAMDAISSQLNENMRAQLPVDVRVSIEVEARKCMSEMMDGIVDTAKSAFQEWADGVVDTRIVSGVGAAGTVASTLARKNHSNSNSDADTIGGPGIAAGILGKEYEPVDPSIRVPRQSSAWNDTSANTDDASFSAGNSVVGDSITEKENMHPCGEFELGANQKVKARTDTAESVSSKPEFSDGQDSPLRDKRDASNKSLTPLPRGIMSTSTTPFSRKATPLQNNHANSRLPLQPSNLLRRDIDFESELHNDFAAVNSCNRIDTSPTDGYSSRHQFGLQNDNTTRNAENKVKVVKKASPYESKRTVESPTTFSGKTSNTKVNNGLQKHSLSETDAVRFKSKVNITVALRKDGSATKDNQRPKAGSNSSPPQGVVGKRGHAEVANVSKSPRRSKRLKEVNRAEHMAAQATDPSNANEPKPKPSQVTPKDNTTPIVTLKRDDASVSSSSVICSPASGRAEEKNTSIEERVSTSNGFDALLGTSVTVPNHDQDQFDDELIGLDESDDLRPEKKSLTYFLPFCGFRNRAARTKGSKTMSKKKNRTLLSYDFDDFDFS